MMFLSYGRIDMNFMSNLPLTKKGLQGKRVFEESRLLESCLNYLEMMFLSYGRDRHELYV